MFGGLLAFLGAIALVSGCAIVYFARKKATK